MKKDIRVKRVYDAPEKSDGYRILVDRLWPRGIKKEDAKVDEWLKEVTPRRELISWFHEDKEKRYNEFSKKYHEELKDKKDLAKELTTKHRTLTLVTAAKDIEHSHIPTLKAFLEKQ